VDLILFQDPLHKCLLKIGQNNTKSDIRMDSMKIRKNPLILMMKKTIFNGYNKQQGQEKLNIKISHNPLSTNHQNSLKKIKQNKATNLMIPISL